MGAAAQYKSMGAASLHKSMGAASLHKSMGDASLHKSMGAAAQYKSMGVASLHKSMGDASRHKSMSVVAPNNGRYGRVLVHVNVHCPGTRRVTHPARQATPCISGHQQLITLEIGSSRGVLFSTFRATRWIYLEHHDAVLHLIMW